LRFKIWLVHTKKTKALNRKGREGTKCTGILVEMRSHYKIVGIGEVLWDVLPGGKQLGGAPGNFAYMASLLGDEGLLASRVGDDSLGQETLGKMKDIGLPTQFLQVDPLHPTGTAVVEVDAAGQPKFTITPDVAWDFLEWTPQWNELAQQADVICFGTLAQRNPRSRDTIRQFLQAARSSALRVFDVNLRQDFFSAELLKKSFQSAQLVKLNHEELPVVMRLLDLEYVGEEKAAGKLLQAFDLKLVCVTRGANGSLLITSSGSSSHDGFRVKVADTVGAGDAFTACLIHHFLRGASLEQINNAANRFAAWVASKPGATPVIEERELKELRA
jgi:fructokinase